MKSLEKTNNKIWIVSGPAAVGKNWSVLEPLMKLNIPNLVVQDMDRLKDKARDSFLRCDFDQYPLTYVDRRAVAWLRRELARALAGEKISLEASKAITEIEIQWELSAMQGLIDDFFKQNREKDIVLGGVAWWPNEDPLKFPEESKRICLYRDPKAIAKDRRERDFTSFTESLISDIEKETVKQFALYEERGWIRATANQVVKDIVSHYQQEVA
jgi:hypothetical protein